MSLPVFLLLCLAGFVVVLLTAWLLFRANDGFDVQATLDRSLREAIDEKNPSSPQGGR